MTVRVDLSLFLALGLLIVLIEDSYLGIETFIGHSILEFNNRLPLS